MKNPKFLQIEFSPQNGKFNNLQLLPEIAQLLYINRFQLFDAFFDLREDNKIEKTIELVQHTAPAFWGITDPKTGELAGVAYLYDWLGDGEKCYSAKVSTCFARKYWGKFAQRSGKLFLRFVFAKYRVHKLCAEVYAQNAYPKSLLANLGFVYEYARPAATVLNTGATDILGYSATNPKSDFLAKSPFFARAR